MHLRCLPTNRFREYVGLPLTFTRLDKNPVPLDVLQSKAEEIWVESGGRWGTPPGTPLMTYDEMCKAKGNREVSAVTRDRRERMNGRVKRTANSGVGDEYVGPDKVSGQATESQGT